MAEVLIAILLIAVVVLAVSGVALTARRAPVKYDLRSAARAQQTMLLDRLKNYVTADLAAGWGPNGGAWTLPNDSCTNCPPGCYALDQACTHSVTPMLPAALRSAPYNMTMIYTVAGAVGGQPRVQATINWDEPQ